MCFNACDDYEYDYDSRVQVRNGQRYYTTEYYPRHGMCRRRRYGLGGPYYPSRYYARPPVGRHTSTAVVYPGRYTHYTSGYTHADLPRGIVRGGSPSYSAGYWAGYPPGTRAAAPVHYAAYIYNPRYGQRGILTYAGQAPNGAPPAGVIGGGYGYGYGYPGIAAGIAPGYAVGAYQPAVYNTYPLVHRAYAPNYTHLCPGGGYGYGYYNYSLYGSLYPLANFYLPYQRTYYNSVPSYGYTAHVYPPGPTTTTTTYHVTNSHGPGHPIPAPRVVRETRPAYVHGHSPRGPTREEIQLENRRIATERGAYDARKIRPADARDDDPFWCREVNGEWHLRSYYQIENECHPGRWMMDAEVGFLVFHRA